ncbi:MAG: PEP-CTERM sorting domain-containing protein [Roseimicrobium sp.]
MIRRPSLCLLAACFLFSRGGDAATTFTDWTSTFGSGPNTTPLGTLSVNGASADMFILGTYVGTGSKFDGTSIQFSDASVFNPALATSDAIFMGLGPSNTTIAVVSSLALDNPVFYLSNIGTGLSFTVSSDTSSAFSVLGSSGMSRSGNIFTATGANGLLALTFASPVSELDLTYEAGTLDSIALQVGNGPPPVVPEPSGALLLCATGLLVIARRRAR